MKVVNGICQLKMPATMSVSSRNSSDKCNGTGSGATDSKKHSGRSKSLKKGKNQNCMPQLAGSGTDRKQNSNKRVEYIDLADSASASSSSSEDETSESEQSDSESKRNINPESDSSFSSMEGPPRKKSKGTSDKSGQLKKKINQILSDEDSPKDDEDEEFIVEKILDMKTDLNGVKLYRVKWLNYGSEENTWEPETNLDKCQDVIEEYNQSLKKKQTRLRDSNSNSANGSRNGKKKVPESRRDEINIRDALDRSVSTVVQETLPITNKPVLQTRKNQKPSTKSLGSSTNIPEVSDGLRTPSIAVKISPVSVSLSSTQENTPTSSSQPSPASSIKSCSTKKSEDFSFDTWLEELVKPANMAKFTQLGNLYYFRIIKDSRVEWVCLDMLESRTAENNELYRCIVTDDLNGKEPKFIYGATRGESGELFCLVQFEGYSYVEVISPTVLFKKYPSFKKYFELHCARHFPPEVLKRL